MKDCTKALEYDPRYLKAVHRRCGANESLLRWKDALSDIKRIIELEPDQKWKLAQHTAKVEQLAKDQVDKEEIEEASTNGAERNWTWRPSGSAPGTPVSNEDALLYKSFAESCSCWMLVLLLAWLLGLPPATLGSAAGALVFFFWLVLQASLFFPELRACVLADMAQRG